MKDFIPTSKNSDEADVRIKNRETVFRDYSCENFPFDEDEYKPSHFFLSKEEIEDQQMILQNEEEQQKKR